MTPMPNPWITINLSAGPNPPADRAAAASSPLASALDVAAEPESSSSTGGCQDAPAVTVPSAAPAGATDLLGSEIGDVHELFYHVRRLAAEERLINHRFVLDAEAFMEAIEPPPLFLRAAE